MEKTDAVLQSTAPRVLLKNVQSQEPRYWSRALHAFFHVGFPPTLSFFARRFGFDAANSELGKKNKPLLIVIPWFCSPDGGWLGDKMGWGTAPMRRFAFLYFYTSKRLHASSRAGTGTGTWAPGCTLLSIAALAVTVTLSHLTRRHWDPCSLTFLHRNPLLSTCHLTGHHVAHIWQTAAGGGLFIHVPFLSHPLADSRTHQFCLFSLHVPSTLLPTTPHAMLFPLAPSHLLLHPGDPSPELGSGHGWRCASGCLSVIARC